MQLPFNLGTELLTRLGAIILGLGLLLVVTRLAQAAARRALTDPATVYRANRMIRRIAVFIGIVTVLALLAPDVAGLLTVLTVIGAGLAIAMREALLSVAGWIRIASLSPFKIGDRIEIGGVVGDVIDIRVLRTTLMEIRGWVDADQSTGRIVHVPNSWIFQHALYNFTKGFNFIWNEVSFTLTFRSDWRVARDILQKLAEESAGIVEQQASKEIHEMSREFLIHYSILTPFVYVRAVSNGVQLTLRYLCDARKRRGTEHAFTVLALDAFRENGSIEFAYPAVGVTTPEHRQFERPDHWPGPPPGGDPALAR